MILHGEWDSTRGSSLRSASSTVLRSQSWAYDASSKVTSHTVDGLTTHYAYYGAVLADYLKKLDEQRPRRKDITLATVLRARIKCPKTDRGAQDITPATRPHVTTHHRSPSRARTTAVPG